MEYHKDITKISKSGLDQIAKSPLHYWERYLNPNHVETSTAALEFGSAFHTAILEPIEFEHMYAVAPKVDRRTKDGKQAWAEFELENMGKKIISSDDYQIIQGMQASILNHHEASILLSAKTHVEQVFTHQDKKCKPDFLTSHNIICDLKTTEDASPWGFGRSAHKYRYDVQAAFYMDILEANGMNVQGFAFIAVEKKPPFAVGVYVIEDEDVQRGREKYQENYATWKECKESGIWKGYGMGKLMLPNYK